MVASLFKKAAPFFKILLGLDETTTSSSAQKELQSRKIEHSAKVLRGSFKILYTVVLSPIAVALAYIALIPTVSIDPGPTFDDLDPFETHFIITNEWFASITKVHYDCLMQDMAAQDFSEPNLAREGFDVWDKIEPQEKFSVYCGSKHSAVPAIWPGYFYATQLDTGSIDICVRFKTLGFGRTRLSEPLAFSFNGERMAQHFGYQLATISA